MRTPFAIYHASTLQDHSTPEPSQKKRRAADLRSGKNEGKEESCARLKLLQMARRGQTLDDFRLVSRCLIVMCSECSRMHYNSILYSELKPCANVNSTHECQLILFFFSRQ